MASFPQRSEGPQRRAKLIFISRGIKPTILCTILLAVLLFALFPGSVLKLSSQSALGEATGIPNPARSRDPFQAHVTLGEQLTPSTSPNEQGGKKIMPRYRVTISNPSNEAMADLVRKYKIQILDHGVRYVDGTGFLTDAIVQPEEIQTLEAAGYHIQRHEDVDEVGKARQAEVGQGNRYEPRGPR